VERKRVNGHSEGGVEQGGNVGQDLGRPELRSRETVKTRASGSKNYLRRENVKGQGET